MKDTKSFLLVLVLLLLIGTWVFHIYDKSKYAVLKPELQKTDTIAVNKALNDSVSSLYQSTVVQLEDTKYDKDSLTNELRAKINEIDTLRFEIAQILNVNNITREDLKKALLKIQLLQQKITVVNQPAVNPVSNQNQTSTTSNPVAQTITKKTQNAINDDLVLQANEIKIQAIKKPENSEANAEDGTDQLNVSFFLKPGNVTQGTANVYLVLKDPAGHIVQDDQWMAGVFSSKSDGLMKYSRKMTLEFSTSDIKKITTHIPVNKFSDGGYQVQIYFNGQRIGKADLVLN